MTSETAEKCALKQSIRAHLLYKKYRSRFALLVLTCLLCSVLGWFTYDVHTYIRCQDPAINKSVLPDTIPVRLLFVFLLLVPFIKISVIEWLMHENDKSFHAFRRSAFVSLSHIYNVLIGGMFSFCIVEFLKSSVGEARPNFMQLCDPILPENCTSETWVRLNYGHCKNPLNVKKPALVDSMKSFPSGHADLGMFACIFMIIYMQKRLKISWSRIFVPFLQLLWTGWGVLCCASRLWDNKHHSHDIIIGAIIGTICSYLTAKYMCNNFEKAEEKAVLIEKILKNEPLKQPVNQSKNQL